MKKIFLFIFLIAFSYPIFAHNGSIKGVVYDEKANQPLVGATILLIGTEKAIASDLLGNYEFGNLAAGNYEIKISYIGYEIKTEKVEVKDNETSFVRTNLLTAKLELSEITVTAPTNQYTNLNTISQLDVNLRPINSSQDILRIVPGLFIAQHAGGGKAEQIFLRGFDIDHGTDINLSVDGMPVNMVSHAHGQGYADLHFVIPETVDKINFQKGPYYARFGNLATAGFVEFNTKNTLDKSMIKLEAGQFATRRMVGMFDILGKKIKNQSAFVAGEYSFSNGYFDNPQNFNRLNLLAKYQNYLDDNKLLNISFSTFTSKWDASGQIPDRVVEEGLIGNFGAIDKTEGGQTSRTNLNIKFTNFLNSKASFSHQVYYSKYDFELYSNFTFFLHDAVNGDQIRQKENRNIYGYRGNFNLESKLGKSSLFSEFGLALRYDQTKNTELSRTKNRTIITEPLKNGDIDETNLSAYIDETLEITPKLTLNAGLRLDYFTFGYINNLLTLDSTYTHQVQNKAILNPKLNLYYDIHKNLRLFFNSGTGFHSNDTRVVVAQNGKEILPKAYGAEIGANFKPFKNLLLSTSFWWLDLAQEFVYVGDEGVVEAGGKTRRQGIDVSLRYQILNWLYLDVDFNVTDPKSLGVPSNENRIPLAPIMTSTGGLAYKFNNGINGSLRYRYMGDRPANEDNTVIAKGYLLVDAVINFTRPRYEFSISAQNIFNQFWKEAQFDTESRLKNEAEPVSEIHFTPGTPTFVKAGFSYFF